MNGNNTIVIIKMIYSISGWHRRKKNSKLPQVIKDKNTKINSMQPHSHCKTKQKEDHQLLAMIYGHGQDTNRLFP